MLNKTIRFFLENKLVVVLLVALIAFWGLSTAPFNWNFTFIPNDPVNVDAIPDLGENQQIVITDWPGRSPQDIDDQITYPLTTQLLSVPGVKTVRSTSMLGLSSIYVIFEDDVDYYWSRSRLLEKLSALPVGTLPSEVKPMLGPDATGLGQIFWYTLEGRDENGNVTDAWDAQELRTVQDYYVKNALTAVDGVAEVASIGGAVKEYQIDIDPQALVNFGLSLNQIAEAVKRSNRDAGARTLEINQVEYFVRGLGYVKSLQDLEHIVIKNDGLTPVLLNQIAKIQIGPAQQRGYLDKSGAWVTGGVVVARYGSNPMQVIEAVKKKIDEITIGLPQKDLPDGRISKVTIVPFYDRAGLIKETLATLEDALILQVLVTVIVVLLLMMHIRASFVISGLLPLAVLSVFIAMKYAGIDANIVALSGIAIAIGTMVDMGIILTENILHSVEEHLEKSLFDVVYESTIEVGSAIITAVSTTIVSFLPVFTMIGAEGKLFKPLAFTKTFALMSSIAITLFVIPAFTHWVLGWRISKKVFKHLLHVLGFVISILAMITWNGWVGCVVLLAIAHNYVVVFEINYSERVHKIVQSIILAFAVALLLTQVWMPLGFSNSVFVNVIFVFGLISALLGLFTLVKNKYESILNTALNHPYTFLSVPGLLVLSGLMIWLGFSKVVSPLEKMGLSVNEWTITQKMNRVFPGLGKEFMPSLDEGSFLLMPTIMPHSGVDEAQSYLQYLDKAVTSIPEVESVVGKLGRVNSALDPAPISMFENVIIYKSEFIQDENGRKLRVKKQADGTYKPDENGEFVRQWRDHIKTKDDIWKEIVAVSKIPGLTSAPKLQPIETRIVMLQSGMRAPMGIKVKGNNLEEIEAVGIELEAVLKGVSGIESNSVFAERAVGKPYLEVEWNRLALARYGFKIDEVQQFIEIALGGMPVSTSVEGRERYGIRLRFAREFRDSPASIGEMTLKSTSGAWVQLKELASIDYRKGPQMIRSEDTFLTSYVIFDKKADLAEVDVIENAQKVVNQHIEIGLLHIPKGVTIEYSGTYENQIRAEKRLQIVLPLALFLIFLILYFQFRSISTSVMIFSSIFVAWAGGFLMIWLYAQPWFLNWEWFDVSMRELFQMKEMNLSVAVWVGFVALFGIASDDGVLIATYIQQKLKVIQPQNRQELRDVVMEAGKKRIRPALMTSATTILALLPVLTSTGKGSDIMVPMAIPTFGGMIICLITVFVIPVLYYLWNARKFEKES
ncbi:cation transporter [bacterium]|nr:MAG: cation transporter [bacterium]